MPRPFKQGWGLLFYLRQIAFFRFAEEIRQTCTVHADMCNERARCKVKNLYRILSWYLNIGGDQRNKLWQLTDCLFEYTERRKVLSRMAGDVFVLGPT